jgi:hypothetical protein
MTELKAAPGCCEEASTLSAQFYIPCNRPATRMIRNTDQQSPYRMCEMCADHNVKNRSATDAGPYTGPAPEKKAGPLSVDYSQYEADATEAVDSGDLLARITRVTRELATAKEDVTSAEASLKAFQERVRTIEEFTLPELMREAGQQMIRTTDGVVVELTETLYASIPAINLSQAIAWLVANGHASIVKRKMELLFGKNEEEKADEALAMILEAGLTPTDKQSVHPQTLAASIREMLAEGKEVPLELLGAHIRSYAKVKPAKK